MSFKDIYHLQLCTSGSGEDVVLRNFLSTALVPVVQEMSFKDISYLQLLYQWFRRCGLKRCIIYSSCTSGSGGDVV